MAVYVSNSDDGEITVFSMNFATGDLVLEQNFRVGKSVAALAISPSKNKLYASLRAEPYSVASLAIDGKTGALSMLSKSRIADQGYYVSTDKSGRFFFMASYSGAKISVNRIDENEEVVEADPQVIETGIKTHAIETDATNRFAVVPALGSDQIELFHFNEESGELAHNTPPLVKTEPGAGPRHLRFSPDNRFVYVINELNGTVSAYRFDSQQGSIREIQSVSLLPENFAGDIWAAQMRMTPDGRYLYTSERTSSTLAAFQRNATSGELAFLFNLPTEERPRAIGLTPDGKYLLVAGEVSGYLSVYQVQASGELVFLQRYKVGQTPIWVEAVALG